MELRRCAGGATEWPRPSTRVRVVENLPTLSDPPFVASRSPAAKAQAPASLVRGLRHMLKPLVRLLIRQRITLPYLARMLKSIYVEVGDAELSADGGEPSASRLSLLTGVHRKDIRELRSERGAEFAPPASVSLGGRLVARWTGDPEFLDSRRKPRALPRTAEGRSSGPSFEELVESVSTDIRPRAVLDEWLRLGVVEVDARDRIRLCADAFVPTRGFDEKAHYFGRNLHDHVAAAAHNLGEDGPPLLERSVYYDGLTEASATELAELSEKLGMQALQAVNRRALVLQRRDAKRKPNQRVNFGVYFFRAAGRREEGDA